MLSECSLNKFKNLFFDSVIDLKENIDQLSPLENYTESLLKLSISVVRYDNQVLEILKKYLKEIYLILDKIDENNLSPNKLLIFYKFHSYLLGAIENSDKITEIILNYVK